MLDFCGREVFKLANPVLFLVPHDYKIWHAIWLLNFSTLPHAGIRSGARSVLSEAHVQLKSGPNDCRIPFDICLINGQNACVIINPLL